MPGVVRLIEAEVARAVEASRAGWFSAAEVRAASEDEGLVERLEAARARSERLEQLKASGLAGLSAEEFAQVIERARAGREG